MNDRNSAIMRAKRALDDKLQFGRVLQHGGALLLHNVSGCVDWRDDNGYLVRFKDGKIKDARRA